MACHYIVEWETGSFQNIFPSHVIYKIVQIHVFQYVFLLSCVFSEVGLLILKSFWKQSTEGNICIWKAGCNEKPKKLNDA